MTATFAYDDLGRRTSLTRGNGDVTSYGYDAVSRLTSLASSFAGDSAYNQSCGFTYNPASQIIGRTASNDSYAWTGHGSGSTSSSANGLNQIAGHGGTTLSHDAKGNLTSDGSTTYSYDSENRLLSASGANNATLTYDPLGRLLRMQSGNVDRRVLHDAEGRAIVDYSPMGQLHRRFVHGPGADEPILWANIDLTTNLIATRRFFHADERGSIVALHNGPGSVTVNRYDEYGNPGPNDINSMWFGYTGQQWLPWAGLSYYKARMYNPRLGRFMQTDPIGYGDGMNQYAYVRNDPVNFTDPMGLNDQELPGGVVTGRCNTAAGWVCAPAPEGPSRLLRTEGPFSLLELLESGTAGKILRCQIGTIEVTQSGNSVTITGLIEFFNGTLGTEGARTPLEGGAERYLGAINSYWSDDFGRYSVTTNMAEGSGGMSAFIGAYQGSGRGGPLYLPPVPIPGSSPGAWAQWGRVIAHEFGHALGLSISSIFGRHLDGGIMNANANPSTPKLEAHISKILKLCNTK